MMPKNVQVSDGSIKDDTGNIHDIIQGEQNIQDLVNGYAAFRLEADLSHLSENDREVLRLLIEASQPMDDVFWMQAYGDMEEALALAQGGEAARRYIEINQRSDMAWLDMKENPIEVVIGPIETCENLLFGAKAAHEGFVLIMEWSERFERFAAFLPSTW